MPHGNPMIWIKEGESTTLQGAGPKEVEMTTKDSFGYLGCEDLDTSRLVRTLAATLEKVVASETAEAVEQAQAQARILLAKVRPLIDEAADSPDRLREVVRQHPLLALGVASLAGFVLASMRRR
jgi:hypothetical protein